MKSDAWFESDFPRQFTTAMMRRDKGAAAHALKCWLQIDPDNEKAQTNLARMEEKFLRDAAAPLERLRAALDAGEGEGIKAEVGKLELLHPEWTVFADRHATLSRARAASRALAQPAVPPPPVGMSEAEFDSALNSGIAEVEKGNYAGAAAAVARLRDEAPESLMRGAKWSRAGIAAQAASVLTAHAQRDAESVKQELLEFDRLVVANPMDCDPGVRNAVDEVRRWQIDAKRQKGEHSEAAKMEGQIEEAERILQAGGVAELEECRTQLASALNLARMKMSNSSEHLKASLQEILERVDRRITERGRSRFALLAGIILILGLFVVALVLVPGRSQIPGDGPTPKPEVGSQPENLPSTPRPPALADSLDAGTWNPKPQNDDFKLPMPAGGFMVFRRVSLGGDIPHFEFTALSGGETLKVYGPFTSGGARCYYLGKYEVSEAQFALFASDPGQLSKSAYPAHDITLEMATGFCSKYSTWLADNHKGTLPRSKAERLARVKLPTRDEWEFAARGGSVTMKDARFRAPHPYGTDLLSRYECFGGPKGAFNKISEIGTRNGNPLGLYDMLGNVREMSRSKSNRTSALNENTLMCGGTYFTPEDGLSAGIVQEQPDLSPHDGRPFHQQDLGFRVILTAEESSFDR